MGFGFSDLGRIILKNNSRRVSKHDAFDSRRQRKTRYRKIRTIRATPIILRKLRAKIKGQNTIENRVRISVFVATLFFATYLFIK